MFFWDLVLSRWEFASLCEGKLWLSSLLTRTGAATQPSHANPTYLLERLPRFGARDAGRKEKNTLKPAQKSRGSEGEDEDVVFKRLDSQRLTEIASALGNSTEIPF